jgi:hypothetical protein
MGHQKSKNATIKRAKKGFLRLLSGSTRVHFFGKEYCMIDNVRERAMPEREAEKVNCLKLVPIIYIEGSCYETPLYDHVLGDKWDSDKDKV